MSKMRDLSAMPIVRSRGAGILLAAVLICATPAAWSSTMVEGRGADGNAALQLAAKIAGVDAGRISNKQELVVGYEIVYGKIDKIPTHWPALVRRALVCQQVEDQGCVHSSMEAINQIGGANTFALNHLFEVSRYGMSVETIRTHLRDAAAVRADAGKPAARVEAESPAPAVAPPSVSIRHVSSNESALFSAKPIDPPPTAAGRPSIKGAAPKTLLQRGFAKLGRLGAADAAGFFLDALFITVAVSLLFAYFLFSAIRGRRAERRERLHALQKIQRLEDLRVEEKVRTDHELWSEQLNSEVALEAQKTHADEVLRLAQHTADKALQAERQIAVEAFKAEQLRLEQIIQAERSRLAEVIKVEQLKTEEANKAAKYRADQAIDAYDQMAARELVYAHHHNDELQEQLNAERRQRDVHEVKMEEALEALEAFKLKEKKLLDIIRAEQRLRASEARQAAEKLKAAQQAAAALQASLVATRALKADLERRADEAMRAAEVRIADARRLNERPALQGVQSVQTAADSSAQIRQADNDVPALQAVTLKDAHSG